MRDFFELIGHGDGFSIPLESLLEYAAMKFVERRMILDQVTSGGTSDK